MASGDAAAVSGGGSNTAQGDCAFVTGGVGNLVSGDDSVAIGLNAAVVHDHALVMNLKPLSACNSKGDNTINICAPNGVFVNGVELTTSRRLLRDSTSESASDTAVLARSVEQLAGEAADHAQAAAGSRAAAADAMHLSQRRLDALADDAASFASQLEAVAAKLSAAQAAVSK